MRRLAGYFLRGLVIMAPLALTVFVWVVVVVGLPPLAFHAEMTITVKTAMAASVTSTTLVSIRRLRR